MKSLGSFMARMPSLTLADPGLGSGLSTCWRALGSARALIHPPAPGTARGGHSVNIGTEKSRRVGLGLSPEPLARGLRLTEGSGVRHSERGGSLVQRSPTGGSQTTGGP